MNKLFKSLNKKGAASLIVIVIGAVVVGALTASTTTYFAKNTREASKEGVDQNTKVINQYLDEYGSGEILGESQQNGEGVIDPNAGTQSCPLHFGEKYSATIEEEGTKTLISIIFYENGSVKMLINNLLADELTAGSVVYTPNAVLDLEGNVVVSIISEESILYMEEILLTLNYVNDSSPVFGDVYHWPDQHDNTAYIFFEDGSAINIYAKSIYRYLPENTFTYVGNTICVSGNPVGVVSDDKSYIEINGSVYENKGASNLIIEDGLILNSSKTRCFSGLNLMGKASNSYVKLPQTIKSIEGFAFNHTNLDNLITLQIPVSCTYISNTAFTGTDCLTDVYYEGTEEQWNAIEGKSFESITTIHFNCSYTK